MKLWEKIILCFLLLVIGALAITSLIIMDRVAGDKEGLLKQLEEIKEKRATESISIGRASKED